LNLEAEERTFDGDDLIRVDRHSAVHLGERTFSKHVHDVILVRTDRLLHVVRSRNEDDDPHPAFARRAVRPRDGTDVDLVLVFERSSFVSFESFV
jgi:hypothetical protein